MRRWRRRCNAAVSDQHSAEGKAVRFITMTPEEIATILKGEFGDGIADAKVAGTHPYVTVKPEAVPKVARFRRNEPRLAFNWLRCVSSLDLLEDNQLAAIYDLHAAAPPKDPLGLWHERHEFAVRVTVPRDHPHIPSVAGVWP